MGKAKVMKYEDIEIERQRRAEKVAETAAKKKGGRKRKGPVAARARAKRAKKTELEVAEDEIAAEGMADYCSVFQI